MRHRQQNFMTEYKKVRKFYQVMAIWALTYEYETWGANRTAEGKQTVRMTCLGSVCRHSFAGHAYTTASCLVNRKHLKRECTPTLH
jgi:hypothetical protein